MVWRSTQRQQILTAKSSFDKSHEKFKGEIPRVKAENSQQQQQQKQQQSVVLS